MFCAGQDENAFKAKLAQVKNKLAPTQAKMAAKKAAQVNRLGVAR